MHWYEKWFNEDYLKLYAYHDFAEAERQVEFIIENLGLTGKERVLDLGCGIGRHSIAFAQRGYSVVGVDISHYLLEKARAMVTSGLSVEFVESDILKLPPLGTFDLVINMFTSFGYFQEEKDNCNILRVASDHLDFEGKFFLDYLNPEQVKANLIPYEEKEIEGELVKIEKRIEGDRVIKTIRFPEQTYVEKVKLYDRKQIEGMLAESGFEVVQTWSGYNGDNRQLFSCRRKARGAVLSSF